MHISAKADYAVRGLLLLAESPGRRMKIEELVEAQDLPRKFLESIMSELRRAGVVVSRRGANGGFELARPASEIILGDVIRAVDGPLADVHGLRPEQTAYHGSAVHLGTVWVAVRASIRAVLDRITLGDILVGTLPLEIKALVDDPAAWLPR